MPSLVELRFAELVSCVRASSARSVAYAPQSVGPITQLRGTGAYQPSLRAPKFSSAEDLGRSSNVARSLLGD
jgi:hypothetical protein